MAATPAPPGRRCAPGLAPRVSVARNGRCICAPEDAVARSRDAVARRCGGLPVRLPAGQARGRLQVLLAEIRLWNAELHDSAVQSPHRWPGAGAVRGEQPGGRALRLHPPHSPLPEPVATSLAAAPAGGGHLSWESAARPGVPHRLGVPSSAGRRRGPRAPGVSACRPARRRHPGGTLAARRSARSSIRCLAGPWACLSGSTRRRPQPGLRAFACRRRVAPLAGLTFATRHLLLGRACRARAPLTLQACQSAEPAAGIDHFAPTSPAPIDRRSRPPRPL